MGRLTQTTYPGGTTESSTYDAEGDRITSTDRANRITSYVYDPLKRLTKTVFADSATTTTGYDSIGEVKTVTDARGNVTQYSYDAAGHRTQVTDALNHLTSFAYDAVGNQLSMTDANGHTTQYQYDNDNLRTKVIYPDSTADSTAYDALGRTVSKTDQAGLVTQFAYDKLGRLTQVTDANNQLTKYTYDEVGNRTTQTDANNHTTTFAYDNLGRRTKRTLPLGMSETSTHDAAGNLTMKTDFNGKTTTYGYDALNRLTSKVPDPSFVAPTVSFTYTATSQRASMLDASGTTSYMYDFRDRLTQKATPEGTLSYTYDPAGNLSSIRSSNISGTTVNYGYDALNRLSQVQDNRLAFGTTPYAYDNVGNLQGYTYPNGVQSAYTYNTLNRLTNLTVAKGATLASYAYTLGQAGNRTQVLELGGRQVNYTYDALYRLTGETIAGGSVNGTIGYQYDFVGNRLQRTSTVAPVPAASYTYDADDRLTTDTYDQDGNTTASGGATYAYDFENHLKTQNSGAVTIVYDGDGNRVAETAGGITTTYLVDDRNLTGYAQVLEEISGGAVQRVYTYGLSRISQSQASGTSFYGYDGHGNVRLLTNATGAVTDRYDYDAFGNMLSQAGTTANVYLYSGEQSDPNLGFYYLRARYYTAPAGRFLTPDQRSGTQADPRTLHRYLYTLGNPVNRRDPSGQISLPELAASVTILEILSIHSFDIALSVNTLLIIEKLDRPGFLATNAAIQMIADTDDPVVIAAAQDLYAKGNRLIGLASADVKAAEAITDLANAAFSLGGIVAGAVTARHGVGQIVNPVLIGVLAAELLVKAHEEVAAGNALSNALGVSRRTVPDLELNKWVEGLLNFFSYAEDAILFLLE
jgi:RHS repeat-associated protein